MPLLVRENPQGEGYEIIAGHRRKEAATWAGMKEVPAIVCPMDDDQSVIAMIDSNLQREKILPSEKAYAYKMRLQAMNRQETLSKQKSEYKRKYTETLASIEPEELADVEAARRMMWYDGELALIQKLRETYGDVFSRRQFDQIVEEVDEKLPVRKTSREQKSLHEKLRGYKREPEQKKKQKKHEMEL